MKTKVLSEIGKKDEKGTSYNNFVKMVIGRAQILAKSVARNDSHFIEIDTR